MYKTCYTLENVSFYFVLRAVKMAFVNLDEDYVSIQYDVNGIKLDLRQFSQLMVQLRGLEAELVKKTRQNRPSKAKVAAETQLKKRGRKQLKWIPSNPKFDVLVEGFSIYLAKEIKSLTVSQCVGCMLGTDEGHEYCMNKGQCIADFLQASMYTLDNDYFRNLMLNEYEIVNYPSVNKLLLNKAFIDSVTCKLLSFL